MIGMTKTIPPQNKSVSSLTSSHGSAGPSSPPPPPPPLTPSAHHGPGEPQHPPSSPGFEARLASNLSPAAIQPLFVFLLVLTPVLCSYWWRLEAQRLCRLCLGSKPCLVSGKINERYRLICIIISKYWQQNNGKHCKLHLQVYNNFVFNGHYELCYGQYI